MSTTRQYHSYLRHSTNHCSYFLGDPPCAVETFLDWELLGPNSTFGPSPLFTPSYSSGACGILNPLLLSLKAALGMLHGCRKGTDASPGPEGAWSRPEEPAEEAEMGARHARLTAGRSKCHLSRASAHKSHSHGHAHSPSPVHFAMQQRRCGSDERLPLLAPPPLASPPQFWGEAAAGGLFCTALAQRRAPAQGLKPSSPTCLCPRPLPPGSAAPAAPAPLKSDAPGPRCRSLMSRCVCIKSPQGPRVSWEPTVTEAGMNSGLHPGYSRCL